MTGLGPCLVAAQIVVLVVLVLTGIAPIIGAALNAFGAGVMCGVALARRRS